jgi:hypothetical protein
MARGAGRDAAPSVQVTAAARLEFIDEYEFIVHPRLAMRYQPRR